MLDQLADTTRAVSTYVRPAEDIEAKVASLYGKISHPVLTNLKLTASENVKRPRDLPADSCRTCSTAASSSSSAGTPGSGPAAVKLTGHGRQGEARVRLRVDLPAEDRRRQREFVEHLWARRKVGYLLDQIRVNGEKKELVDEVVALAKKYGIATPYTSYLIVPDAPMPVASAPSARPDDSRRAETGEASAGRTGPAESGGPAAFGGGGGLGIGGGGFMAVESAGRECQVLHRRP